MKIGRLRWSPYSIPFRRPLATSHGPWRARDGIILEIETDNGMIGLGDVAPLPDFGTADLAACIRALENVAPRLTGADVADATRAFDTDVPDSGLAPLRCAIESACIDIEARAAGKRAAAMLASASASAVAVNAIAADEDDAVSATAAGYRAVKLKVGAAKPEDDLARLAAVRRAIGPGVALRIDTNGAWSEVEAIAFLRQAAAYDIEFVEQPVAPGHLDALRRVRETTGVAVAVDEDVTSLAAARRVVDASAADVLIVKPAVAGGPRRAMEMIDLARAAGVDAVVTSAMESGVGVAAALHVAAAARTPRACGLGTLELLVDDLTTEELPVVAGALALPEGAGLGVTLDRGSLARYAAAPARTVPA